MESNGAAVLVVDDDRLNRTTLRALLEGGGLPGPRGGGRAGRPRRPGRRDLRRRPARPADAGDRGLEVLAAVKSDSRLWRIPVLVISGVEDTGSIVRCLELGAEDFVSEPFDPLVLRARINAALARRTFGDLEAEYHKIVEAQAAELAELRSRLATCACGAAGGPT